MNTSVGMDSGLAAELVIVGHFGPDPLAAILNDGRERANAHRFSAALHASGIAQG
jgi:hypothetical protein